MMRIIFFSYRLLLRATLFWSAGLAVFIYDMETFTPPRPRKANAIVVLTGGADRLKVGVSLLKNDLGEKLLLSGVNKKVRKKDLPVTKSLPIDFGYQAKSTIENAYEARRWLQQESAHSFFLVTAHYHMRRSLLEFHQRLKNIDVIPYPVRPDAFKENEWFQNLTLVTLVISEYNKYILALCRAFLRICALTLGLIK
tara:strand:+ start:465 stop:1055 length:591 start_codon:yes stop_codon:yes gene_type:complete